MAIKIKGVKGGIVGGKARFEEVEILCDTEEEILAFGSGEGHVIEEGSNPHDKRVKPLPYSMAHTAGYQAIYELSPSFVWTKM